MSLPVPHKNVGFPSCINITIEFNPFATYYQSIHEWLDDERRNDGTDDFINDDEREKSLTTNCVWVAQWYPITPVGFMRMAASTFETLMDAVNKAEY